ncbi:MAG: TonB-dependent receptor plug [Acidobacteriales bacterium]|nr:TonB-dependent receptor plug [Terriglobales bacterium]
MFTRHNARMLAAFTLLMCLCFATSMVTAQSTTSGAVSGVVTDSSGAVVPGAKVEVRNTGTNSSVNLVSDDTGRFRAVNLQPGNYEVKVTAANFSGYKATCFVEIGRSTDLTAKLKVSGTGETVEVKDEAPVINTEHQDFANNVNQIAISNLPINGRRWSNYALGTPTANPDGTFGLVSFRGISGLMNNNTIDGGDNNSNFYGEERGRTRLSYSVSQDSVQEFQVNTSNFSSEYGRSAGGAVNTVTKSGTNALHGTGYWYFRDNAVGGATNPSTLLNGVAFKPEDRRQQFGATIGGPIIKDKAFFFFNWDQQKRNFPGDAIPITTTGTNPYGVVTVTPTPAVAAAGANPALAAGACPTGAQFNGGYPASYNLGNVIYCRYGANVAAGQAAATAGYNFITGLLGSNARKGDQLLLFPKVDVKIAGGNLATSYNWLNWTSPFGIQTQPTNTIASDQFGSDLVRARSLNSIYNRPTGTNSALELRFHWSTENLSGDFQDPIAGQPSVAGPTGSHPPGVFVTNWLNFGTQTYLPRPANPQEDQYQFVGNWIRTSGKHTFKFGGEVLHQSEEVQSLSNAYGTFNFTGSLAFADFLSDAYNPGTSALTGSAALQCRTSAGVARPCYSTFTQGIGTLGYHFTTNDYAFFLQDNIKVSQRLSLNMGLRYELQQFPSAQFANPAAAQTSYQPSDQNNFGPRFGFAYDILGNSKLVFRGGYGMYYGRIINSTVAAALVNTGMPTAQPSYTISNTQTVNGTPVQYPNILASANGLTLTAPNIAFFSNGVENPLVHEFDGIVEYEIAKNTVVSFSYLNSMGRGLLNFLDTNLPTSYQGANTFTLPDSSTFTIPTYGTAARPNTAFNQMTAISNGTDSDYHAYVFQVTRRLTNNWQMQSSYTYSKAQDNGQNSVTFSTGNNALDPANPNGEWGLSNFDVPHKFTFSAVWQPSYFKDAKSVAHYVLDGWTLAPIIGASSGSTFTGTISGSLPSASCAGSHSTGLNCASPGSNRPGNLPRNSYRTNGRYTTDLRLARSFNVTERANVEFITEAFNLFNHPNISSITGTQYSVGTCSGATNTTTNTTSCTLTSNAAFATPSGGGIDNGTNLRERQIQFAIRVRF